MEVHPNALAQPGKHFKAQMIHVAPRFRNVRRIDEQYVPRFERVEGSEADLLDLARDKPFQSKRRCKK